MGMHNSTDRLRKTINALTHFYEQRHQQMQAKLGRYEQAFDPEVAEYTDKDPDGPYYDFIEELSEGVDQVCEELGVELDPLPPGDVENKSDEQLMAGARLMKWNVDVHDRDSGQFIGRFEWAMYHRHDRFSIPGPAQLTYLKARGGNTMVV
ncbi:hypothetical protein BRD56_02370 [Thermoplasmatales archaeon SW_10_69_26]|nr:MAG: hypothetical protein BRD56_02370 [Thermoplasmatales archaeon SW_10_69_26]